MRQYAAGKELPELLLHELGQAGPVGAVGCFAKKGLQMGADDGSPLSSAQPLLLLSGNSAGSRADGLDEISNTGENMIAAGAALAKLLALIEFSRRLSAEK